MSMNSTLSSTLFSWWYKTIFTLKYTHLKIYVRESKWEKICFCVKSNRHLVNKLSFANDAGTKYYLIWFSFPRSRTSFSKQETIWFVATLLKNSHAWPMFMHEHFYHDFIAKRKSSLTFILFIFKFTAKFNLILLHDLLNFFTHFVFLRFISISLSVVYLYCFTLISCIFLFI